MFPWHSQLHAQLGVQTMTPGSQWKSLSIPHTLPAPLKPLWSWWGFAGSQPRVGTRWEEGWGIPVHMETFSPFSPPSLIPEAPRDAFLHTQVLSAGSQPYQTLETEADSTKK